MNKFAQIVRYILALILIVFGANKIPVLEFLPPPGFEPGSPPDLYFQGLGASGYFFLLLALTEIGTGVLLAINKWVPLALVIYAPVALNILLFHLTMAPAEGVLGYIVFLATTYLIYVNKDKYQSLLT